MDIKDKRLKGIPVCSSLEELSKKTKPLAPIEITVDLTRLLPFQNYRPDQTKGIISVYPCAIGESILSKGDELYFYFLKSFDGKIGHIPQALDLKDIE